MILLSGLTLVLHTLYFLLSNLATAIMWLVIVALMRYVFLTFLCEDDDVHLLRKHNNSRCKNGSCLSPKPSRTSIIFRAYTGYDDDDDDDLRDDEERIKVLQAIQREFCKQQEGNLL